MPKFVFARKGQPRIVTWPVTVQVPRDHGAFEAQTFDARFEVLTDDEIAAMREAAQAKGSDPGSFTRAILRRALKGAALTGEDGAIVVFDEALKEELIHDPHVRAGLVEAFFAMQSGRLEKN
jgi:hypothetical protein